MRGISLGSVTSPTLSFGALGFFLSSQQSMFELKGGNKREQERKRSGNTAAKREKRPALSPRPQWEGMRVGGILDGVNDKGATRQGWCLCERKQELSAEV